MLLLLGAAVLTAEALLILTAAAVALLLTVAGWCPALAPDRPAAAPLTAAAMPAPAMPATPAAIAPAAQLEARTVAQLRRLARAAGLPQLGRSGRRADLLEALAMAPG